MTSKDLDNVARAVERSVSGLLNLPCRSVSIIGAFNYGSDVLTAKATVAVASTYGGPDKTTVLDVPMRCTELELVLRQHEMTMVSWVRRKVREALATRTIHHQGDGTCQCPMCGRTDRDGTPCGFEIDGEVVGMFN